VAANDAEKIADLNRRLVAAERAFLDPAGIPDRPWYRHLIYAPKHTYAPELLPGVAEAIDAGAGDEKVETQVRALADAIRRAAATLSSSAPIRPN
jgi:N-acetylated-alpha-linked acidic dipeptidase